MPRAGQALAVLRNQGQHQQESRPQNAYLTGQTYPRALTWCGPLSIGKELVSETLNGSLQCIRPALKSPAVHKALEQQSHRDMGGPPHKIPHAWNGPAAWQMVDKHICNELVNEA